MEDPYPAENIDGLGVLVFQTLDNSQLQRVPALRAYWDLEKTVLHEFVLLLWSPTNAKSPTYTYISQKSC